MESLPVNKNEDIKDPMGVFNDLLKAIRKEINQKVLPENFVFEKSAISSFKQDLIEEIRRNITLPPEHSFFYQKWASVLISDFLLEKLKEKYPEKLVELHNKNCDIVLEKGKDVSNKFVLIEKIQLPENDCRQSLARELLEEFPILMETINKLFKDDLFPLNKIDLNDIDLKMIENMFSFLKKKLSSESTLFDDLQTDITQNNFFVMARPEITHSEHANVAGSYLINSQTPDAFLGMGVPRYNGPKENILNKIKEGIFLVNNNKALPSHEFSKFVNFICGLLELFIRDKCSNQKNTPLLIVRGGGYLYYKDTEDSPKIRCSFGSQGFATDWDVGYPLLTRESEKIFAGLEIEVTYPII